MKKGQQELSGIHFKPSLHKQLIGRLMGDYILKEGCELPDDTHKQPDSSIHFSFRMQLKLPTERHEALKTELRELVTPDLVVEEVAA